MAVSGRLLLAALLAAPLLASCGSAPDPSPHGLTGGDPAEATPRALDAVIIDHIARKPRREDGRWSEYGTPREVHAQVDYGVNPEGGEPGETITVRATVSDITSFSAKDLAAFGCASDEPDKCEAHDVDGVKLLYRWYHGAEEEEPGNYTWTAVRKNEVVRVEYEPSGYFDVDPRTLDLPLDPEDLRAIALDPAMSLRTTTDAVEAGRALGNYDGPAKAPVKPVITTMSRSLLLKNVQVLLRKRATSSRATTVTDFGLKPVSVHLEFAGSATYDPVSADVFTAIGRTPLVDPAPCKVGQFPERVRTHCFGVDRNHFSFWEPASAGKPGVLWIVGVEYDHRIHRPVSAAVRFSSTGLTEEFLISDRGPVRFSRKLRDAAYDLVRNLSPVQVGVA
ncbi:MAG: hypothetical protein ACJ72O_06445 [Marmoricola sp.]